MNAEAAMNPDEIEVAEGREQEVLHGSVAHPTTDAEVREALEKAFDYRGDITITRRDGSTIEGYVFDRHAGNSLEDSFVRILPTNQKTRVRVSYTEIAALAFSGKDTAAGKSFESWIKKYWEKKAAGETNIQIEPEKLE